MTARKKMDQFNQRAITDAATLGQKLKQVREQSHYSVVQVSEQLRIKPEYIEAIEQSRYTALPSGVFVKNYVQRYVKLLGLNWLTIQPLLEAELKVYQHTPDIPTQKRYLAKQPLQLMRVVIGLVILFAVIALAAYFGLEITNIVEPPRLEVVELPNQLAYADRIITLAGQTDPEAVVSINDQVIPVLPTGQFSQQMSLQSGSNLLKIEAKTKRSQPHIQYLQIYVEDQPN
ncbi:MAG TPA: hypothetical protein DEG44_04010 [Candidatus Kerfeldbacteria bacterium]|nr:hypothetical protein [Candidatus Kerfeldbacteria bacterium]